MNRIGLRPFQRTLEFSTCRRCRSDVGDVGDVSDVDDVGDVGNVGDVWLQGAELENVGECGGFESLENGSHDCF